MEVLHGMMEQIERQRLSKMMDEMPDNVTIQQRYTSSQNSCTNLIICFVGYKLLGTIVCCNSFAWWLSSSGTIEISSRLWSPEN